MPAPRRRNTVSDDELLTDMVVGEIDTQVDSYVAGSGPPPGTTPAGDAQKVRLWGRQDKKVDPDLLRQRLQTTGLGQEAPKMVICQERPELVPLYMSPVQDPDLIDTLVRLAQYPFRPGLFAHLEPDPSVAEANRLDRMWQATLPPQPQVPEMPSPQSPMAAPAPAMLPEQPMTSPAQPAPVGV